MWETARPVIERWIGEHLGPRARIRNAAERIGALAEDLPQLVRSLDDLVSDTREQGLRLRTDDAAAQKSGFRRALTLGLLLGLLIGGGAAAVIAVLIS